MLLKLVASLIPKTLLTTKHCVYTIQCSPYSCILVMSGKNQYTSIQTQAKTLSDQAVSK